MGEEKVSLTVTAGDKISPINRVYVEITSPTVCYPVLVPIVFLG